MQDLRALFDVAHAATSAAKVPWRKIAAVGVGVPGAFDPRSETVWAPNLPRWSSTPLRRLLEQTLKCPTFVEGDRNMQALAEAWLGVGAQGEVRNLVFLTVGTGIGAGLISEGRLISGAHGVSGAVGWMAIDRAWKPLYGRIGCLEALGAIFVSRGDVASPNMASKIEVDQHNTVFRNLADGTWRALTDRAEFSARPPRRHRGAAVADFNHDGKLDVVVSALSAPSEIWMNDSPDHNHWLELALQGTKSNRDGIGARIKVTAGGKAQFNHMTTASGYASSSAGPVHFGLGTARIADEIEIRWPSGTVQVLRDVAADRVLSVKEPE
jgi:hypothetical protein